MPGQATTTTRGNRIATSDTSGDLTDDTPLIIEWRQTYTEECRAAFTMRGIRPLLGSYPPDADPVDLIPAKPTGR